MARDFRLSLGVILERSVSRYLLYSAVSRGGRMAIFPAFHAEGQVRSSRW